MRFFVISLLVLPALAGVSSGNVVLDLVDGGTITVGGSLVLHKYTVTAQGAGITTLSKFSIATPVYQAIPNTEWSQSGSVPLPSNDSHIIFGNARIPDLMGTGSPTPGGAPAVVTTETGAPGLGTLNNYDEVNGTWDAYLKTGVNPDGSTPVLTNNIMQLLVEEGEEVELTMTITTHTGYEVELVEYKDAYGNVIDTAYYAIGGDVELYELSLGTVVYMDGDANKDGKVDLDDLSLLGANWGTTSGATWEMGNFDDDGDVDLDDLSLLGANWGYGTAARAYTPEPNCFAMLLAGSLCLLGYRNRRG